MSQLGTDTSSGEAVPSSSASSRRDGSDLTVPATPPIAHARADADSTSSTRNSSHFTPDTSQQTAGTSSISDRATASLDLSTTTTTTTLPQIIPDSQESASMAGGDTRPAADMRSHGGADVNGWAAQSSLQQLSVLAQERADQEQEADAAASRKRMANGEVKTRSRSNSPIKGHVRSVSAISTTSTGSHIGDMSADLKTRLAYAMIKVNNGWQSRSLDEVESLASQGASPVSSNSTLHGRQSSSSSPRPRPTSAAQVHFALDPVEPRRKSHSPPGRASSKPSLAPPAAIQPSLSRYAGNSRRTPIARHPPALLTHSHSASAASRSSPRQHAHTSVLSSSQPARSAEAMVYSPHASMREQDAIETLIFMSSPNNSTNLRHAFSPSVSPAPPQHGYVHDSAHRHGTASSSFRKGLPGQRPVGPQRRVGFDPSPAMGPPGSPMDLDSPQQQQQPYRSPHGWTPKRRANGASGHLRGALSLPSGLGLGGGRARPALLDEEIDRILDRAAADSSDDEDIQLPPRTNGMADAVGI
ncbi:cyclin-dependent kinase [Cordyceps militaris CM01]|uniref:Cyclin-dependent kinase n=1 Tax=Cordyceps militaris (strain CM01) TaxID=983644 RepID=G3J693_CORMM|nr:cyclin-dependent kinase [Cordyceps militaris CM01]EGX96992.1 cyclin-dependent kinase [Cordyceps militaris CM01]